MVGEAVEGLVAVAVAMAMAMGRLGFSIAKVGRGASESTVDVRPGTRTTGFWTLCGFWEYEG